MSTVVGLEVPAEEMALDATLSAIPDGHVELEPTVGLFTSAPRTLVRASCAEFERLDRAIRSDDSATRVALLAAFEDEREWLYRAELRPRSTAAVPLLAAEEATLLGARSRDDTWLVRMLFPERTTLSSLYDTCRESGSGVELEWVRDVADVGRGGGSDLTTRQCRAVATAYRLGYYDIPRRATGGEVAEALDISHQALSELLCRGHRNLVEALLRHEDVPAPVGHTSDRYRPAR